MDLATEVFVHHTKFKILHKFLLLKYYNLGVELERAQIFPAQVLNG